MDTVSYTCRGNIAVATVESPPVNSLTVAVRRGLIDAIDQARSDPEVAALIIIGGGKTFVAGADIREFGKPYAEPTLYAIIDALQTMPKPVVAAIHGTALGGGLELAFGCHWRIAAATAKVGLPEVRLGLIPGAGGTQYWTRLAGPQSALEALTSGQAIDAPQALDLGLVDAVTGDDLLEDAMAFARRAVAGDYAQRPFSAGKAGLLDPDLFEAFRKKNARKWRGLIAPGKIVDCIEAACTGDLHRGLALEKAAFAECLKSPQHQALAHLFFAERAATKIDQVVGDARALSITKAAVIGAGTMGGGIAMAFANAGIPVTLLDRDDESLARGRAAIEKTYDGSVQRGSLSDAARRQALERIRLSTRYQDAGEADIFVEAVFEDLALKQDVFRQMDAVAKPGAILATNTSTLDIDAIAAATSRPENVVGMHFFSPANIMKLLENVRGQATSPTVIATVMALAKTLGKTAVLAGNADGFIGNRILEVYSREADLLLQRGATPWQIDAALTDFGFPMGLYTMRDMAGVDVVWRIQQLGAANGKSPADPIVERLYQLGRYGQKTGRGYYLYQDRVPTPDPEVDHIIADRFNTDHAPVEGEEILSLLLCAMVNAGAQLIEGGVARRASDIDIVYVHGYGFPAYRGGPMFWAQQTGLGQIHDRLCRYHDLYGAPWAPSPLIGQLARSGQAWPT